MSLYVYCPRLSNGAMELVDALGATRLRGFDGMDFWRKRRKVQIKDGDIIVCWGDTLPEIDDVRVLNGSSNAKDKYDEVIILAQNKIQTVKTFRQVPKQGNGFDLKDLLPRRNNHVGGSDLLHRPYNPDYWVVKENLVNEYRIHSFAGKSIRAGKKIPRVANPHAWIRSFDAGWRIDYDGFKSNEAMRKLAHRSVKALGLTFGAVDIGEKNDGTFLVLEVNRAPGIEGNSVEKYAEEILKWVEGKPAGEDKPEVVPLVPGAVFNKVQAADLFAKKLAAANARIAGPRKRRPAPGVLDEGPF